MSSKRNQKCMCYCSPNCVNLFSAWKPFLSWVYFRRSLLSHCSLLVLVVLLLTIGLLSQDVTWKNELCLSECAAPKRRLAVGWRLTWNLVALLWMDLVQIYVGCPLLVACCIGIQVQWKWVRIARAFLVNSTLYWH